MSSLITKKELEKTKIANPLRLMRRSRLEASVNLYVAWTKNLDLVIAKMKNDCSEGGEVLQRRVILVEGQSLSLVQAGDGHHAGGIN